MMRALFVLIPALGAWCCAAFFSTLFGMDFSQSALVGLPVFLAMVVLGIHATSPHPERGEGYPIYEAPPLSPEQIDALRYQWLRRWKGQEHEPPFTVQHEEFGTLWGADLDHAIDTAKAEGSQRNE